MEDGLQTQMSQVQFLFSTRWYPWIDSLLLAWTLESSITLDLTFIMAALII